MASKSTINKRVHIYINGREVSNDIKSIRTEMQKAVNDIARMKRGSDEYNAKAKEIRTLKAIIQEHNQQLRTTEQRWSSLNNAANGLKKEIFRYYSFFCWFAHRSNIRFSKVCRRS